MKTLAKNLEDQLKSLEVRLAKARIEVRDKSRTFSRLESEYNALLTKVQAEQAAPRISDHAVIRYLERKHGFCFEDIRADMMTDRVKLGMDMGAHRVGYDGGKLVIKNRCAVTWITK